MAEPPDDLLPINPVQPKGCTPDTCFDFYGNNVYYERMGAGNPEKLLLLTGSVSTKVPSVWLYLMPELAKKYDVVGVEYLGMGRSSRPRARIASTTQVEVSVALMDHLGWAKAHVLGFSAGGRVLIQWAKTPMYQDRLATAICNDGNGIMTIPPGAKSSLVNPYLASNLPGAGLASSWIIAQITSYNQHLITETVAKNALQYGIDSQEYDANMQQTLEAVGQSIGLITAAEVNQVKVPFAVLWGDHDEVSYTAYVRDLYKQIPTAVILPDLVDCGHNNIVECHGQSAEAISAWIDTHPTPASPLDMGTD